MKFVLGELRRIGEETVVGLVEVAKNVGNVPIGFPAWLEEVYRDPFNRMMFVWFVVLLLVLLR